VDSHTKKSTRIIIWVIAIVMAAGFLGSYFLVILENNNNANQANTASTNQQQNEETAEVDPTAYKVTGAVESLIATDEVVGTGDEAHAGDTVKVHYKGTVAQSGVKFDSSYDRGEPIEISLSNVIQGWQEGVPGMHVGGKRRLVIPAAMGYGAQSSGSIPANSDLVFEVELLGVTPATPAQ
jgi:peptidylprolyl isomerase